MPARERGETVKRGRVGAPRVTTTRMAFPFPCWLLNEDQGSLWVDRKVDDVEALRAGERSTAQGSRPWPCRRVVPEDVRVNLATTEKLRYELRHATPAFGEADAICAPPPGPWRATLPARSRHQLLSSFRQVLGQAVAWGLRTEPDRPDRNRRVKLDENREILPFASCDEVGAISAELVPADRALPIFLVHRNTTGGGAALEWKDIDARTPSPRSSASTRRDNQAVPEERPAAPLGPLRGKVLEALEQHPRRIHSRLVFPGHDGDYLKQITFRMRHWTPALRRRVSSIGACTPQGTPLRPGRSPPGFPSST